MSKHTLLASLIIVQLIYVNCFVWAVVGIGTSNIAKTKVWTVEVHNQGRHHAHLWYASADNKIAGAEGLWVQPGGKISWPILRKEFTQFWCTMDWYGQRVAWDVFVANWKDPPNPTIWSIRNDGVYDQWRNHKWLNLIS